MKLIRVEVVMSVCVHSDAENATDRAVANRTNPLFDGEEVGSVFHRITYRDAGPCKALLESRGNGSGGCQVGRWWLVNSFEVILRAWRLRRDPFVLRIAEVLATAQVWPRSVSQHTWTALPCLTYLRPPEDTAILHGT